MITDPRVVRFANEKIRVTADTAASGYWTAKSLLTMWQTQGLAALIPNDSTVIDDGALVDGRPVMTGALLWAQIHICQSIISSFEAVDPATGMSPIMAISAVAVNGQGKF